MLAIMSFFSLLLKSLFNSFSAENTFILYTDPNESGSTSLPKRICKSGSIMSFNQGEKTSATIKEKHNNIDKHKLFYPDYKTAHVFLFMIVSIRAYAAQ